MVPSVESVTFEAIIVFLSIYSIETESIKLNIILRPAPIPLSGTSFPLTFIDSLDFSDSVA